MPNEDSGSVVTPTPDISVPAPVAPPVVEFSLPPQTPPNDRPNHNKLFLGLSLFALVFVSVILFVVLSVPKVTIPEPVAPSPTTPAVSVSVESIIKQSPTGAKLLPVSGTTIPNSPVVVYTDTHQSSTVSDAAGNYSTEIELDEGVNALTITTFLEDGTEKTETHEVNLTSPVLGIQIIKGKPDREFDQPSTPPGQLRREFRVEVRATPSAQLKKSSKRHAIMGIISTISGNTITLTHQIKIANSFTITVDAKTVYKIKDQTNPTLSQLKVGDRIVVVGDSASVGKLLAKLIMVIPGIPQRDARISITPTPSATPSPTVIPTSTPIPTLAPTPTATP